MEQAMLWVTIIGMIVLPILGLVFNVLITNKFNDDRKRLDELESMRLLDRKEFYEQLNGFRKSVEENYVLQKIYDQAMDFKDKNNDEKFKSILSIMNTQFQNMEDKIGEIKILIKDKFNGNK